MLYNMTELVQKYNLKVDGVVHCGAHLAEEAQEYLNLRIRNVWWIEANPLVIPKIRKKIERYGHHLIEALLLDEDDAEMMFHITNYDGMSSSVYEFGRLHLVSSPETRFVDHRVLTSRTLDSLVAEHGISGCNFLNMDLQGAEVPVLRGASKLLESIDYIYTEVNEAQVYVGIELLPEMDRMLAKQGFRRVAKRMTKARWGDAFFMRKELI